MTLYVGAREAANRLGVSRATLYAYVSRGVIQRRTAIDGRTSLYPVDDLERLTARSRRRETAPRPSIDVQIGSAVTRLDEAGLWYQGRDALELARSTRFERVAELLWTGVRPEDAPRWPRPSADELSARRQVVDAVGPGGTPIQRLVAIATVLGARHPDDDPATAAKRMLMLIAADDTGRRRGTLAGRLAKQWHQRPSTALVDAIERALILLADHELATSTLAVRVAISVRPDAYAALTAGLATVSGRLHGSAAAGAYALLADAAESGPSAAIAPALERPQRLPGFGHSVYRNGDPRLIPLLEVVRELPDPNRRRPVVDQVLAQAGLRTTHRANVDFGLGALAFVGGLDPDVPIFAVARLAGWAAHAIEELSERPVRFRGLARHRPEAHEPEAGTT